MKPQHAALQGVVVRRNRFAQTAPHASPLTFGTPLIEVIAKIKRARLAFLREALNLEVMSVNDVRRDAVTRVDPGLRAKRSTNHRQENEIPQIFY